MGLRSDQDFHCMQKIVKPSEIPIKTVITFFEAISQKPIQEHFNPHPFDESFATWLTQYNGKDEYFFLVEGQHILAYGMLRGWDEHFERPSLGICSHPSFKNQGHANTMMSHLIQIGKNRKVKEIILKVKRDNLGAKSLYKKFGFLLKPLNADYESGVLRLDYP